MGDVIEVDIGFQRDVARSVYVVPVNHDATRRVDGMDEVVRMKIPKGLKVIGLTKCGLFSAINAKEGQADVG